MSSDDHSPAWPKIMLALVYGYRCSSWPAGLLLSEFVLSHPELFYGQNCVEVCISKCLRCVWGVWICLNFPSDCFAIHAVHLCRDSGSLLFCYNLRTLSDRTDHSRGFSDINLLVYSKWPSVSLQLNAGRCWSRNGWRIACTNWCFKGIEYCLSPFCIPRK